MTIFKQYGEERSGTNFLKRLIELNFSDAVVFGSVLGWKHGMFQLTNGHQASSASSHEDWIVKKKSDGRIFSVDNQPLPYGEEFLLGATHHLNYLISYKPILPWLASVKRFRFPKRDYDENLVRVLFERYLANYEAWLALPNAVIVTHDILMDDSYCKRLLLYLGRRHGLRPRERQMRIEQKVVNASTDHGLIISDSDFARDYYGEHTYLSEIPAWVVQLSERAHFCTTSIDEASRRSSARILGETQENG